MELYKESLLNKIEDDLTGRNQNWDAIETHLADYNAHVAEDSQKHIAESGENANGRYIKFDTGMIMQWHSEVFTQESGTTKDRLLAFPMAFPNECVSLVASLGPYQHTVWVSEGYLNCFAEKDRVRIVQRYGLTEGRAYCISYTAIGY